MLRHPVLATFVSLKWKKIRGLFYFQSFIYILFLICYTAFIGYWFTRPDKYCPNDAINKTLDPCSIHVLNSTEAFDRLHSKLFEGPHASVTFLEATLLITSVSLLLSGNLFKLEKHPRELQDILQVVLYLFRFMKK